MGQRPRSWLPLRLPSARALAGVRVYDLARAGIGNKLPGTSRKFLPSVGAALQRHRWNFRPLALSVSVARMLPRAGSRPLRSGRRAPTEDAMGIVGVSDVPTARGVTIAPLQACFPFLIIVAPDSVFFLRNGMTCDYAPGVLLKVVYTETNDGVNDVVSIQAVPYGGDEHRPHSARRSRLRRQLGVR
jgi:hypothetical protein